MTRRDVLKMIFLGMQPLIVFPDEEAEAALSGVRPTGKLSFHNLHTDEKLAIKYLNRKGRFDNGALKELNHLFRCHHTGQVCRINPRLFLVLDSVRYRLGAANRPYCLVSGYRSPAYNRLLSENDCRVARNSYHIRGMAADIYIDGIPVEKIVRTAKRLKCGGVGKYSQFVHLDVGPVRYW